MNPGCQCHGSRAGPQITHPSHKYHIAPCCSLDKSSKGTTPEGNPRSLGLAIPSERKRRGAVPERPQQRASACPCIPAVDSCTGDFAEAEPENKANTGEPRTEQLGRKGSSVAFTPACRGKHGSLIPIATCAHLLHPQVSIPSRSFVVLLFPPTDFGFCLKLFIFMCF